MEKKREIELEKMNLAELLAMIGPREQRKESTIPEEFWEEISERLDFAEIARTYVVSELDKDVQKLRKQVQRLGKQFDAMLKALSHVEVAVSLQKYVKLMGE
ncbi:MAG: hypothetical protein ACTSYX_04920 [Candidatus Thorarchaeota archaeon]